MKDWQEKVSDDEVHCPMCGHIDTSEKWWTTDQINKVKEIATSWAICYAQEKLGKAFKKLEKSTRNNKYFKVSYKPNRQISFINNPIGQCEEWETEICCEKCNTHYSVIGSAYFCPCCGYNSAVNSFENSLESIDKMLDSLDDMKTLFTEKYNSDKAETMCRGLLEESIGNTVSAFQKFACCLLDDLTGKANRVNDFQIVAKGSELFKKATGKSYGEWLSDLELSFMNIMFQRRHLFEHNNGIVDQKYIDNSSDNTYSVGQRLVAKQDEVYRLLTIIKKLGKGIIELKKEGSSC